MGKITLQSQKCAKLGHGYTTIKRREIQLEKKNVKLDKNNCDFRKTGIIEKNVRIVLERKNLFLKGD